MSPAIERAGLIAPETVIFPLAIPVYNSSMCNLYSLTKRQQAIRDDAKAMVDRLGNMPSLPAIFPNGRARIVRQARRKTHE